MQSLDWCYLAPGAGVSEQRDAIRRYYAPEWHPHVEILEAPWGSIALVSQVEKTFSYWEDADFLLFWAGTLSGLRGPAALCRELTGTAPRQSTLAAVSGQFACIAVHKPTGGIGAASDHLSTIPVFHGPARPGSHGVVFGTHADLVARLTGRAADVDPVALAELLVERRPTFPHTLYREVKQLAPASITTWSNRNPTQQTRRYWSLPRQTGTAGTHDIADALRDRFVHVVRERLGASRKAALLLSGGADSRMVLAAIPDPVEIDCFTFGEGQNDESRTAERIARAQNVNWTYCQRAPTHYLDQIGPMSKLIGYQYEALQPHTHYIAQQHNFAAYDWVAGGWFADTYLRAWFMPQKPRILSRYGQPPATVDDPMSHYWNALRAPGFLNPDILDALEKRRRAHLDWIATQFDDHHAEWAHLWPATQHPHLAGHHGSRRMYHAFEPFMDHELFSLAAQAPAAARLDGSLFRAMARPLLKSTRRIPHVDGSIPYYGPWVNVPVKFAARKVQRARRKRSRINVPKGSWPAWPALVASPPAVASLENHRDYLADWGALFAENDWGTLMKQLGTKEKLRFLQLLMFAKAQRTC